MVTTMSCAKTAELIEVFFGSGLVWGSIPQDNGCREADS